jgi:hypothetical protein
MDLWRTSGVDIVLARILRWLSISFAVGRQSLLPRRGPPWMERLNR